MRWVISIIVEIRHLHDEPEFVFIFLIILVEKSAIECGEIVVAAQVLEDPVLLLDNFHMLRQIGQDFDGHLSVS